MRTLIVAQGLERARILAAVSIHAPNKVIVLRNTNDVSKKVAEDVEKHMQLLQKEVQSKRGGFKAYPFVFEIDTAKHKTDFFDIAGSFRDLTNIIENERKQGNEVSIDLSTGTKTIAMAMFLAGQLNKLNMTYCKAGKYLPVKSKGKQDLLAEITSIAKEPLKIPNMPIKIEKLPYNLLRKINEIGTVSSISNLLREMGQKPVKSNILSTSRKLDLLAEYGYIEVKRVGKRKEIKLTELGKELSKLAIS